MNHASSSSPWQRSGPTGSALTLLLLLAALAGCAENPAEPASTGSASPAPAGTGLPVGNEAVELDPAEFTAGSKNPYFPLEPGQRWTYREVDEQGSVLTVVVTVSSETRRIANGIAAAVVRDTVTQDGELIEDTLDWYAQDADGNVWYLGEDTAEFEDGKLTTRSGSFEAGVDGALPGIIMPADPQPGLAYRQEFYVGEAEDNGAILAIDQQADTAAGHFDDVVLTADTITLEPDVLEYKLYAPGVGLVSALGIYVGGGREDLVSQERVSPSVARAVGRAPLGTPYE